MKLKRLKRMLPAVLAASLSMAAYAAPDGHLVIAANPVAPALPDTRLADAFGQAVFYLGRKPLPYRLLAPQSPQAGVRYPLVLVLHGSGAIGSDNRAQMGALARAWAQPDLRQQFPAYVVVPQFASRSAEYGTDAGDGLQDSAATPALDAAFALVEYLRKNPAVDSRRIYVVGFSMGASAAWNALLLRPDLFAAGVPMSGIAPPRSSAPQLAGMPVLIMHGAADTENPIDSDRAMYAALRDAGASRVLLREYTGLGHDIAPDNYTDSAWRSWLFEQRKAAP